MITTSRLSYHMRSGIEETAYIMPIFKNNSGNSAVNAFRQERPKGFMRKRFLALLIDIILIVALCYLIFMMFGTPDWVRYMQTQDLVRDLPAADPLVVERMALYQKCFVTSLIVAVVYEALLMVLFGGSVGKLIFRLRVVSSKEAKNPVLLKLRLALRSIIKALSLYLLSAIPFLFMCLTAFGNAEGRSGFDLFVGTKVIDKKRILH